MSKRKRILFLLPYPLQKAPSQRFRVELFLPILESHGINYRLEPFMDDETFSILYRSGYILNKSAGIVKAFIRRFWVVLFVVPRYNFVFIHREVSPLGPPLFEFIIAKIFKKKIIYDFDDAIWIPDSGNSVLKFIKCHWKISYICKWAHRIAAGNEYLCHYANAYNQNVVLLPTCVDTEKKHNCIKNQNSSTVTIGWTGSHSTLRYLDPIVPVLQSLANSYQVKIIIICNRKPQFSIEGLKFISWNEVTEIEDLLQINIGIMPLEKDQWSAGKCGFKLIQYLSLGIPAVASPVGVNKIIIRHGNNGFLATNLNEWENYLRLLIQDAGLRKRFGEQGRQKIKNEYSLQANEGTFLGLFN